MLSVGRVTGNMIFFSLMEIKLFVFLFLFNEKRILFHVHRVCICSMYIYFLMRYMRCLLAHVNSNNLGWEKRKIKRLPYSTNRISIHFFQAANTSCKLAPCPQRQEKLYTLAEYKIIRFTEWNTFVYCFTLNSVNPKRSTKKELLQ